MLFYLIVLREVKKLNVPVLAGNHDSVMLVKICYTRLSTKGGTLMTIVKKLFRYKDVKVRLRNKIKMNKFVKKITHLQ